MIFVERRIKKSKRNRFNLVVLEPITDNSNVALESYSIDVSMELFDIFIIYSGFMKNY